MSWWSALSTRKGLLFIYGCEYCNKKNVGKRNSQGWAALLTYFQLSIVSLAFTVTESFIMVNHCLSLNGEWSICSVLVVSMFFWLIQRVETISQCSHYCIHFYILLLLYTMANFIFRNKNIEQTTANVNHWNESVKHKYSPRNAWTKFRTKEKHEKHFFLIGTSVLAAHRMCKMVRKSLLPSRRRSIALLVLCQLADYSQFSLTTSRSGIIFTIVFVCPKPA